MKTSLDRLLLIVVVILVMIGTFFMSNNNQRSLRKVEKQLDTLTMKLEKMENITGYVIENMRYNLVLMENMSATLAHSGAVLGDLIRETRDISGEEKKKISQAISEIEAARKLLEEERRNALQLFEEINSGEYD